ANSAVTKPGSNSGGGAGRGSSGNVGGIPGVARGPEVSDDAACAVGKFMQVEFAQQHSSGRFEPADNLRIRARDIVLKDRASGRGPNARRLNQIFNRYGNAVQRALPLAANDLGFSPARLFQGRFRGYGDKGVELGIATFDFRQAGPGKVKRR